MRRFVAQLVLLAIVLGASAPLFAATQVDSSVHACCRRGGAHHCLASSTDTAGFHARAEQCPFRCGSIAHPRTTAFTTPKPVALTGLLVSHWLTQTPANDAPLIVAAQAPDTRGPPAFSLA
jgi:hypothetical protein